MFSMGFFKLNIGSIFAGLIIPIFSSYYGRKKGLMLS